MHDYECTPPAPPLPFPPLPSRSSGTHSFERGQASFWRHPRRGQQIRLLPYHRYTERGAAVGGTRYSLRLLSTYLGWFVSVLPLTLVPVLCVGFPPLLFLFDLNTVFLESMRFPLITGDPS